MHKHTVFTILISGEVIKNMIVFPLISIAKVPFQTSCAPEFDHIFLLDQKYISRWRYGTLCHVVLERKQHFRRKRLFSLFIAQQFSSIYCFAQWNWPVSSSNPLPTKFWQAKIAHSRPFSIFMGDFGMKLVPWRVQELHMMHWLHLIALPCNIRSPTGVQNTKNRAATPYKNDDFRIALRTANEKKTYIAMHKFA